MPCSASQPSCPGCAPRAPALVADCRPAGRALLAASTGPCIRRCHTTAEDATPHYGHRHASDGQKPVQCRSASEAQRRPCCPALLGPCCPAVVGHPGGRVRLPASCARCSALKLSPHITCCMLLGSPSAAEALHWLPTTWLPSLPSLITTASPQHGLRPHARRSLARALCRPSPLDSTSTWPSASSCKDPASLTAVGASSRTCQPLLMASLLSPACIPAAARNITHT